jgi:type II secretory pathway pseudopilin PulG
MTWTDWIYLTVVAVLLGLTIASYRGNRRIQQETSAVNAANAANAQRLARLLDRIEERS